MPSTPSMNEGTLVHEGLAMVYRAIRAKRSPQVALEGALDRMREVRVKGRLYKGEPQPPMQIDDADFERLLSVLTYYVNFYYANDMATMEPVLIEETLEVEIRGVTYEFTIDLAAKLKNRPIMLIVDHKTISQTPRQALSSLQIDPQFMRYEAWGREHFLRNAFQGGFEIVRNLVRRDVPPGFGTRSVLTASGRTSKASTDPADYLHREHFARSPRELRVAIAESRCIMKLARSPRPREEFYRTVIHTGGEACGNCTFHVKCAADFLAGRA